MAYSVLISGAGQLGSRYLQGLAKCRLPLDIFVHDVRQESLDRARQRWNEVQGRGPHSVSFQVVLDALPRRFDLAIVATTADVRPGAAARIASHASVRFWVLEKVLAQGESGVDELMRQVGSSGAWVNTPRRAMPWYREIKSRLAPGSPLTLDVRGGPWGLACNAVHFLDLLAWLTGERLESVSTAGLAPEWLEGKRPGFMEVYGTLDARYSGGSRAILGALPDEAPFSMTVGASRDAWQINEAAGTARRSDGTEIPGRLAYQSEMTAALVDSLLDDGRCDLPALGESAAMHCVFLRSLLEHWRRAGHPAADCVPIT